MNDAKLKWISYGSVSAVLIGYVLGLFAPELMLGTAFIGGLFLNALKVIVAPLVIAAIVTAVIAIKDSSKVGKASGSAVLYFAATSAIAAVIGLVLVMIIKPGMGITLTGGNFPGLLSEFSQMSIEQFLESLIPSSIPGAVVNGNYLGLMIVSIIFGLVLFKLGRSGKKISDLFDDFNTLLHTVIGWLLTIMPFGLLFLVGQAVAESGGGLIDSMSSFMLVVLVGFAIQALVIIPLALKLFSQQSLTDLLGSILPALAAAFGSGSAVTALPVTVDCTERNSAIDKRASSYVLPLGAVINSGATAMYAVIGTVFIAQVVGFPLAIGQIILMTLTAIALSFAVSSVQYSSLFVMFALFGIGGFPQEAYAGLGLLLAVDWLLSRFGAVVNVWSDLVGAAVVGDSFVFKTATRRSSRTPARTGGARSSRDRDDDRGRGKSRPTRERDDRRGSDREDSSRGSRRGGSSRDGGSYRNGGSSRDGGSRRDDGSFRDGGSRRQGGSQNERSPFTIDKVEDHPVDLKSRISESDRADRRPSRRRERSDGDNGRPEKPLRNGQSRSSSRYDRDQRSGGNDRKEEPASEAQAPARPVYQIPPPPPLPVMKDSRPSAPEPEEKTVVREEAEQLENVETKPAQIESPIEERAPEVEPEDIETEAEIQPDLTEVEDEPEEAEEISAEEEETEIADEVDDEAEDDLEKAESVEERPEEETEPQTEKQFGRRGRGRSPRRTEESGSQESESAVAVEEIKYSTEQQHFGRAKRKKTR